ncbi:MAG: type II secretion system secretin GspD [Desulfuromonadaceae bacterium]|nr:type II secretion system secretin GspD [Desulfuromonadaceae bacterium]
MLSQFFRQTVFLSALLSVLCFGPFFLCSSVAATSSPQAAGDALTLDFKDIELSDLVQTISALTGKNFVYDDSIRGKATIISSQPISQDEAYKLFLTVLNIKGFTVVPAGKTNKIVPIKSAKENNVPTTRDGSDRDQFITRMITLSHISAADIAESILSPLMPKTSNVVVYEPSNKLIISDNASNIERLEQIIRELDLPGALQDMQVIPLQYADAGEAAKICNDLLTSGTAKTSRRRTSKNVTTSSAGAESKVVAYERTNRLVVMATTDEMNTLRELIRSLDQKPTQAQARIHVYYLENADSEELSKTLNEILTGVKTAETSKSTAEAGEKTLPLKSTVTISADKPTNALIINATAEDYVVIQGIIQQLDIRRKQVYVEALIMELSMDATGKLGLGLQGGFEVGNEGIIGLSSNMTQNVTADLLTNAVEGILAGGFSKLISYTDAEGNIISLPAFSALLQLSQKNTDINILSAPRLLTSDNEEAEIVVGRNVPIITKSTDDGDSNDTTVSVERKDVALTLRFTPQISAGNLVRLSIYQETTDLASNNVGNIDEVGPTFTTRKLRNTVLARNGQTVVLGGLISTNNQQTETRVPLLGDIPLLGWLFRSKSTQEVKTNLLVFITPSIISEVEDLAAITSHDRQTFNLIQHDLSSPTPMPEAIR